MSTIMVSLWQKVKATCILIKLSNYDFFLLSISQHLKEYYDIFVTDEKIGAQRCGVTFELLESMSGFTFGIFNLL